MKKKAYSVDANAGMDGMRDADGIRYPLLPTKLPLLHCPADNSVTQSPIRIRIRFDWGGVEVLVPTSICIHKLDCLLASLSAC